MITGGNIDPLMLEITTCRMDRKINFDGNAYFPMPSIVVIAAPSEAHSGNRHYKIKQDSILQQAF